MPTDFAAVREICLPAIEKKLLSFLRERAEGGLSWTSEMSRYQFSTGGKRLRALLPCWVYAACGADPLEAVTLGCAVEMIHNATLVHDDLQDGDAMRRGQPTVWKKFSEAQAINCGDAMFQFGIELLLESSLDPAILKGMARRLLNGVTEVIEGQAQEFLLKDDPRPTVDRYLRMARGKTAALISVALTLAAESLGKDPSLCHEIERTGMDLGLLFQMQDDLLDIYGDKGRDQQATDIAEGKVSILIAQLLEDASERDRALAMETLRKPREKTTQQDTAEIVKLFEKYGIRDAVLRRVNLIRERIRAVPWGAREPALHLLVLEVGEWFLQPIRHLLR